MSKEPEDSNEEKSLSHYIGLGVALGAGIGTALGSSLGVAFDFFPMSIGVGTAVGVSFGIIIGSVMHEQNKNENTSMPAVSINKFCPRSGKSVVGDSFTKYKGFIVGFCNPGCRDDFTNNIDERPNDSSYFDAIIKENGLDGSAS